MKRIWLSRKFSYIYEASPSSNLAFFMQSLYSHSIGSVLFYYSYVYYKSVCSLLCLLFPCTKITLIYSYAGYLISNASLSHRLGGLFCLYCLYETQPFKPPFKIYLSLGTISPETWYWILINFLFIALVVGIHWRGNIHIASAWHVMQCWYGNNSHIFQALCQLFGVGYIPFCVAQLLWFNH